MTAECVACHARSAASQLTTRTIGGTVHTYSYDGSGRRTGEVWNGGASARSWKWNERGHLATVSSKTPAGTDQLRRYVRSDGVLITTTAIPASGTQQSHQYTWDISQPLPTVAATRRGTTITSVTEAAGLARIQCNNTAVACTGPVAHDVHGSAVTTTDTADAVAATDYSAFGDAAPATLDQTYGYRGELEYGGLVHLRARDYDPDTGLFLSPDPLDGVDGTTTINNPYHYSNNDPINSADPTGLRPTDEEMACPPGETFAQGTATTNEVYLAGTGQVDDPYPTFCNSDVGGLCFAWEDGCTSFISQWTGGSFCSAWFDDECTAIKTSHPGLYRASLVIAGGAILVAACAIACPASAAIVLPGGGLAALTGVTVPSGVMVLAVSQGAMVAAAGTLGGVGVYMASAGGQPSQGAVCPPGFEFGSFVNDEGVKISIHPNDHGPPHAHVDGGGPGTRIGQNGKPVGDSPTPTAKQQKIIDRHLRLIRNQISSYMRWHAANTGC